MKIWLLLLIGLSFLGCRPRTKDTPSECKEVVLDNYNRECPSSQHRIMMLGDKMVCRCPQPSPTPSASTGAE